MSFQIQGYGICTDDIKNTSIDKIKALIAMAPDTNAVLASAFDDADEDGIDTADEFAEYMGQGWSEYEEAGLATILAVVIEECEGIKLLATTDSQAFGYLVMPKKLPWDYTHKEKNMTENALNAIFRKYISVLTDYDVTIENKDIEYD